jgi:hypothetical protein
VDAVEAILDPSMGLDESEVAIHRDVLGHRHIGMEAQCRQPTTTRLSRRMVDEGPAEAFARVHRRRPAAIARPPIACAVTTTRKPGNCENIPPSTSAMRAAEFIVPRANNVPISP